MEILSAMTFSEALAMVRANASRGDGHVLRLHLAAGITPNHLMTFVVAHAARRCPNRRVACSAGEYGDLVEAIAADEAEHAHAVLVVMEWSDLDPRLGLRRFATGTAGIGTDILETVTARLGMIAAAVMRRAADMPIVLSLPTLRLPPVFLTSSCQTGLLEIGLQRRVLEFAETCLSHGDVSIANEERLDEASPQSERYSVSGDLGADMPYRAPHLSALAATLVENALPAPPLK